MPNNDYLNKYQKLIKKNIKVIFDADKIFDHLYKYWNLSKTFFNNGQYEIAAFFGITLIEEVGKAILVSCNDDKAFYDHRSKYYKAVIDSLLHHSRTYFVYGKKEDKFAKWFREGELFKIRNKSLYIESSNNILKYPIEEIKVEDAFLLVCFSGEIFAEIQGHWPTTYPKKHIDKHYQIIGEINEFIKQNKTIFNSLPR